MPNPACDVCGQPMRLYGKQWKCMTSPKDHKKILDAFDRGARDQGGEPSPANQAARRKNLRSLRKKNGKGKK